MPYTIEDSGWVRIDGTDDDWIREQQFCRAYVRSKRINVIVTLEGRRFSLNNGTTSEERSTLCAKRKATKIMFDTNTVVNSAACRNCKIDCRTCELRRDNIKKGR